MANVCPLKGWRFNPGKVKLDEVLAPPYDVISPAYQDELYARSPHNCIRLILNKETSDDHAENNRYTRARETFLSWCKEGILVQETRPAFYVYRQIFQEAGIVHHRTALIARVRLEPFENHVIIPHEKTLAKPREDRRRLIEETQTNFSPVFGLYEDLQQGIESRLNEMMKTLPLFQAADDQGVEHAVWAIQDETLLSSIHSEMQKKQIYIADGHHRYQTALDYSKKRRAALNLPADTVVDSDYVLMALVAFEDPGLILYPTHRLMVSLKNAKNIKGTKVDDVLLPLRSVFAIEKINFNDLAGQSAHGAGFGFVLGEESYWLTVKDWDKAKEKMTPGKVDLWYKLDVNLITHLILKSLWEIPESEWEKGVRYTHSATEAQQEVVSGRAAAGFILQAPPVHILRDMGKARELMPQKSTYFYPKLASGIVFYHHA